jgi:hypothetical protein
VLLGKDHLRHIIDVNIESTRPEQRQCVGIIGFPLFFIHRTRQTIASAVPEADPAADAFGCIIDASSICLVTADRTKGVSMLNIACCKAR